MLLTVAADGVGRREGKQQVSVEARDVVRREATETAPVVVGRLGVNLAAGVFVIVGRKRLAQMVGQVIRVGGLIAAGAGLGMHGGSLP